MIKVSHAAVPAERVVRPTTVIESTRLNQYLDMKLVLASETFQETGSFKFRAAYNVTSKVSQKLLIAASSGNFGQALAYACALTGKSCIVVMPSTSSQTKIRAVSAYGGQVELIDTRIKTRSDKVRELALEHPDAYIASSSDDSLVIAGNSSLGVEISSLGYALDSVIAPIGGGGLASGLIIGIRQAGKAIPVIGAEPLLGNDAARSMREGRIVSNDVEPLTIADGARTLRIGERNWAILKNGLKDIIEVPEDKITEAVRLLFGLANLKVEPTGALGVAAILTAPRRFQNRTICCVVSGGNVDATTYVELLGSGTV